MNIKIDDFCEGTYVTADIGEREKADPKQTAVIYKKDRFYVHTIFGQLTKIVDYTIQQSDKPMDYNPDEYDDPEDFSVPDEIVAEIADDVWRFLAKLLETDYGCHFPLLNE